MSETSKPEPRTFTEAEVAQMMEKHRKGLQQTVKLQELRISHLEDQVRQLSRVEHNPIARILLAAMGKEPVHA